MQNVSFKVQLNIGIKIDFFVWCIVNSFDFCSGSEPGFFRGEIKRMNNASESEIGSIAYA